MIPSNKQLIELTLIYELVKKNGSGNLGGKISTKSATDSITSGKNNNYVYE